MITRMAPTPSGYLHLGNLFNFMLAWLWGRAMNGKILLRIDDADQDRFRIEYLQDIFYWLDVLGLEWDIGPTGPDDFLKNWSQQKRMDLYRDALDQLWEAGHLYACTCSRTQNLCDCKDKEYDRHTGALAWKITVPGNTGIMVPDILKTWPAIPVSDFLVKRKDGIPAYPLISVTDDRYYLVTHIVRGEDLLESTARQIFLERTIRPQQPAVYQYWHHPLLLSDAGLKLSKSSGHLSESLRKSIDAKKLPGLFAAWMGWHDAVYHDLDDLLAHPSWESMVQG